MVPSFLKSFLVPGTPLFFLLGATVGTLLLYRKKDHGRTGRTLLAVLILFYWIASTPLMAQALIYVLTSEYTVQSAADARDATAIVVLSGGMQEYRSRGSSCGRAHGSIHCVRSKPHACIAFSIGLG